MPYNDKLASSYVNTISKQLNTIDAEFPTIYIGGGTPTVIEPGSLEQLLAALKKSTGKNPEFTIEANPESLDDKRLSLFLDGGVNRLSIGIQSFNDTKLVKLGRIHDSRTARNAVESAAKKGFKNISIDLIFGVWEESAEIWRVDLEEAANLPVTHISCYSLTCEKSSGSVIPLEEERSVDMYEYAIGYLPRNGFKQYEISSFSKDGHSCRHNLNYWENNPYIGIGPSAVSYMDNVREENISDIVEYINRVEAGKPVVVSGERLDPERRAKETAALKIRTMEGIDFEWFKKETGFVFLDLEKYSLPKLSDEGLIEYGMHKGRTRAVRLSRRGILFCDIVSSAFL